MELYLNYIKQYLAPNKVAHSVGVAQTAAQLANTYKVDKVKAYIAGLLHDTARQLPPEKIIAILKQNNYAFIEEDYIVPDVLHGAASAALVKKELNITDNEILQAIINHTTGKPAMSKLDTIIFLADMIEPNRDYPGVEEIRKLVSEDLFKGLYAGLKQTSMYLINERKFIHPRTIETYNWLINTIYIKNKEEF